MIKFFGPYHIGVLVGFICSAIYEVFLALGGGSIVGSIFYAVLAIIIVLFIINITREACEKSGGSDATH